MQDIDVEEWNFQTVALCQALLGAISPNFRMVSLNNNDGTWLVSFFLEQDDDMDREEVDDVITRFDAQQDGEIRCRYDTVIGPDFIDRPSYPARSVFWRREL